jgi:hypothetical protein
MLCSSLHPHTASSLFAPNIFLSTLFSNPFSLCSSINIRDEVSHAYKTIGKIVFYILMFTFFDNKR